MSKFIERERKALAETPFLCWVALAFWFLFLPFSLGVFE